MATTVTTAAGRSRAANQIQLVRRAKLSVQPNAGRRFGTQTRGLAERRRCQATRRASFADPDTRALRLQLPSMTVVRGAAAKNRIRSRRSSIGSHPQHSAEPPRCVVRLGPIVIYEHLA